ncbi:Alpha/Beta hydrolase protein [Nemania serpens]|nr:Alpha/Beta hydrolase protein [Nemania serpens]
METATACSKTRKQTSEKNSAAETSSLKAEAKLIPLVAMRCLRLKFPSIWRAEHIEQSVANPSNRSKMSEYGLEELCPREEAEIDVVFVHGLFGNRRTTWTEHGVLWPLKLLPGDLPKARILTFGYDADVTKLNLENEITRGTIETHAADLCERLVGLRAKTDSSDRPLVFIAHSLGGLVCAQAMVKGSVGDSAGNSFIIASNTRGMVFLGTPFHGSPVAPWAKIISTMLSAIHETDTRKIKDLDQKSDKLKILAESFAMTLNQRIRDNKEIRVSFFHETKSLHGSLIVPEPNSRISGFGDHASINADHSAMCKFADQETQGYQSVLAAIQKVSVVLTRDGTETSGGAYVVNNNNWGEVHNQVLRDQIIHGGMRFGK